MKFNNKNVIFLLGGKDLEMETIRDVLIEEGFIEGKTLFDKQLSWGAKLSAYADVIQEHKDADIIYGIELAEDMKLPENYRRIDHHNDYCDKEASLLQVLKLFNREPTREALLIAANDTGHTEGMKAICATPEEIREIRKKERRLQGITEADEQQAKEEIAYGKEVRHLFLVKSGLEKYAAITDFCNKRPLLVYGNGGIVFFGEREQVQKLSEAYANELKAQQAYHGRKYFGFDKHYFSTLSQKEQRKLVVEIIRTTKHEEPIPMSYHAFMFPFRFDRKDKELFEDRISINAAFYQRLQADGWEYVPFAVGQKSLLYNEYSYFTEPVRDTLYNKHKGFQEGESAYYFSKPLDKHATYTIEVRIKEEIKRYTLKLTDISLRLFETGIGILVFEMENRDYTDFEDVLKINEYGRRVYPQFLGDSEYSPSCATKGAFLAESITVRNGSKWEVEESFSKPYNKKIPSQPLIGQHIIQVLGNTVFSQHFDNIASQNDTKSFCSIAPALDDRMFVVSYAENETLMNLLKRDEQNFLHNDSWYRYLFVDGQDKTVQYRPMQEELLKKATYPRWLGWRTLWGISRYSLVALTTPSGRGLILPHAQYQYHQMAILILVNYASLTRFSDEVSQISETLGKTNTPTVAQKVASLYRYYIKFTNNLHFRQITFQDQGIEMYEIAKQQLGFDREVAQLDNEIAELHTYIEMAQEKERNRELDKITKIGAVFLPPSLMSGILGINSENFIQTDCSALISLTAILLSALLGWIMVWDKIPKVVRQVVAAIGFVLLIFGTPYLLQNSSEESIAKTVIANMLPQCDLNNKEEK